MKNVVKAALITGTLAVSSLWVAAPAFAHNNNVSGYFGANGFGVEIGGNYGYGYGNYGYGYGSPYVNSHGHGYAPYSRYSDGGHYSGYRSYPSYGYNSYPSYGSHSGYAHNRAYPRSYGHHHHH